MQCPFCEPKDRVLKENTHAYVILSNPRKMEGHFLVIPKRHVEKPWEITEAEHKDIFELINLVQQRITKNLTEGCDVRQHYRPFLMQGRLKVDHMHYHVLPRSLNDEMHTHNKEDALFKDLTQEEHARIAKLLDS